LYPFSSYKIKESLKAADKKKHTTALSLGDLIHKIEENPSYVDKIIVISKPDLLPKEMEILELFSKQSIDTEPSFVGLLSCYCETYNNADTRAIKEAGYDSINENSTGKSISKIFEKVQEIWEKIETYVTLYVRAKKANKIVLNDLFPNPEEILDIVQSIPEILSVNEKYQDLISCGQNTKELVILWKYLGESFKSMLDRVILDHKNKRIIYLDVKTCGDGRSLFLRNYLKFSWFRQMAVYREALLSFLGKDYEDYTIEIYILAIYYNQKYSEIFYVSPVDLDTGKFGGKLKQKGYETSLYKCHDHFKIEMTHSFNFDQSTDGIEANDFLNHIKGFHQIVRTLKEDYYAESFGLYQQS